MLKLPALLRFLQPIEFPHKLGILDRAFGRRLSSKGTVWVPTAAGIQWKLDLSYAPNRWSVYGKYEGGAFLHWARTFLKSNSLIVDSGANIGQMLLYLAQWVLDGKVVAFEPGAYQADWLQECLRQHPSLAVETVRLGLGESNRAAYLKECGPPNVHGGWSQVSETEGEAIRLVALSDFLAERNIEQVDLWKLDVEGFEVPALNGAVPLLRQHKIRALYIELAGDNGSRVKDFLAGFGYRCFFISASGKLSPIARLQAHCNGLFLPV